MPGLNTSIASTTIRTGLTRGDVVGLITATAGLGAVLGVVWWALAPRVVLDVIGGATYPAEFQPGGYIADDGIAAIAGIVGGLLTLGLASIIVRRRRSAILGYPTLGWTLLAGVIGAVLMWWTGSRLGAVDLPAAIAAVGDGGQVQAPLILRMPAVLVLWPLASAAAFAFSAWLAWVIRPVPQSVPSPPA